MGLAWAVPFARLVMFRSVTIEAVSISGMYIYIEIASKDTSIAWYSLFRGGVGQCQDLGNQGIPTPLDSTKLL